MRLLPQHRRYFRLHALLCVIATLIAASIFNKSGATLWILFGWTIVLLIHYLIAKSLSVNDDWGETRAYKVRQKTYDLMHIDQIVDSAVDGNPKEDPAAPRNHR